MDFNQLLAKMVELDQPVPEMAMVEEPNEGNQFSGALKAAQDAGQDEFEVDGKKYKVKEDGSLEECPGDMSPPMAAPSVPQPSMSVNVNAQGMDNIESLMKLLTKVNPDMINQPMPPKTLSLAPMPSMTPPGPRISSIGDLGDLDKGPLKMLPSLDRDGDGDHDMDDHDMEKNKDKEEAYGNSLGDSKPEIKDADYMNNKLAGGMNRPKGTHPKVAGGDNPMQRVDTRESIRTELLQRLAEAKGAK